MLDNYTFKNGVKLRNRIVIAPMTTYSSNDDLTISDQEIDYYKARSKGAGMVITGCTFFSKNGQGFENEFSATNDSFIPSLKRLADSIKGEGAKAILQIFHSGRMALSRLDVEAPSSIKPLHGANSKEQANPPRTLTSTEIKQLVEDFYHSTVRAIKAGFDGVEIHGANTYLIQQFFSGASNVREDEWGGSIEKRMNFPKALVDAAIQAKKDFASSTFIIGYRFSPEEIEENGITLEQTEILVDELSSKDIDYLSISLGNFKQTSRRDESDNRIIGSVVLKKINGRVPLIGVGGIKSLDLIQEALNLGYDMLAIGSSIIIDPNWVEKTLAGTPVDTFIDVAKYKEKHIPDKLFQKLKSVPGWIKIKE